MRLCDALDLTVGEIVAFIGAGGKTRALFRLADELAGDGWRVISTTTMSMSTEEIRQAPQRLGTGHGMRVPPALADQVERYRHVFLFTRIDRKGVRGVRPTWLDNNLGTFEYHDILLVEADGSANLPMKAPKPEEPSLPDSASLVIPVIGLDAIGQPLAEEHIYGATYINQWIGHALGTPLTPSAVAASLLHPALGRKGIPQRARVVPLLNKVTAETLGEARSIARLLLTDYSVDRVMIGAVQEDDPVWEIHQRVGAVVLAAGQSTRMGEQKVLLPWQNTTVIRHIVREIAKSGIREIVVVTGEHNHRALREELYGLPGRLIKNPDPASQMFESLQMGLDVLWSTCGAALVMLGDQPMVSTAHITRLLRAYQRRMAAVTVPSYRKRRGHPILLDRSTWGAVLDAPQATTLRDILRAYEEYILHVEVNSPAVLQDIDTPEDYKAAKRDFDG